MDTVTQVQILGDTAFHIALINKVKVKLVTVVGGDPKAPFSLVTTLKCRGGHYTILWLLHFTLDLYLMILSVKQGSTKYHFLGLWYDLNWDWMQVSWTIGEHFNHLANSTNMLDRGMHATIFPLAMDKLQGKLGSLTKFDLFIKVWFLS